MKHETGPKRRVSQVDPHWVKSAREVSRAKPTFAQSLALKGVKEVQARKMILAALKADFKRMGRGTMGIIAASRMRNEYRPVRAAMKKPQKLRKKIEPGY